MQHEELKRKNSSLSVLLIIVNIVLVLILFNVTPLSEDQQIVSLLAAGFAFVVLIGFYAFSYKGKGYRTSNWIFGISLVILLILIGFFWYLMQLAKAFQH